MKSAQSDVINDLTDTINQLETVQQQLRAEEWIRQIKESFPGMDVMCDNLSLGLSCHIGPDGLGIACCNKAE